MRYFTVRKHIDTALVKIFEVASVSLSFEGVSSRPSDSAVSEGPMLLQAMKV